MNMDWFRKNDVPQKGQPKKDIPDGLWTKCKNCGESLECVITTEDIITINVCVCDTCMSIHYDDGFEDGLYSA